MRTTYGYSLAMSGLVNPDGTLNKKGMSYIKDRPTVIESLIQLQELAEGVDLEIFMQLKGCKSSKTISYYKTNDIWCLYNDIGDSTDKYGSTREFVAKYPFFFRALETRNIYLCWYGWCSIRFC